MQKKWIKGAGLVCCITLVAAVLAGLTREEALPVETVKTVVVQEVRRSADKDGLAVSGNIVPRETVKLSFKVAGQISEIRVSEGELVKEGQILALLDSGDYSIAQKAALAQWQSAKMQIESDVPVAVNQAQAQLELTEATYERVKELYDGGAASQAQLDEVEALLTVHQNTYQQALDAESIARTELEAAEAAYQLTVSQMDDTVLNSTIGGVVLQKVMEAGEVAAAGYPVVAVGQIDQVYIEAGVPDDVINQLAAGQAAQAYVYGLNETVDGTISEIGFLADSYTRMFTVKILVDNPDLSLRPGMTAKVQLAGASAGEKLYIPFSSVVQLADGPVVFLYDETTGQVKKTTVETGALQGGDIEILSGLKPGNLVVAEGQFRLKDGETVALKEGEQL